MYKCIQQGKKVIRAVQAVPQVFTDLGLTQRVKGIQSAMKQLKLRCAVFLLVCHA
jgi:hypothetical protein